MPGSSAKNVLSKTDMKDDRACGGRLYAADRISALIELDRVQSLR
jgi:hypothetical protein